MPTTKDGTKPMDGRDIPTHTILQGDSEAVLAGLPAGCAQLGLLPEDGP